MLSHMIHFAHVCTHAMCIVQRFAHRVAHTHFKRCCECAEDLAGRVAAWLHEGPQQLASATIASTRIVDYSLSLRTS